MTRRVSLLWLAVVVLSTASCKKPAPAEPAPALPSRSYSVTGMVMSVQPPQSQVVVKHEKIPGYMMAMTMPFLVRDTNALSGLIPGEEITFTMVVTADDAWIENIEKTGKAENILPAGAGIRIVRDVEPLEAGDPLPDYAFVSERGQAIRLSQFRGQALALSFLFTRCPVPTFCPLTARKLAQTQNQLLARPGGPTNWHILAITMDPGFDTPERLRQFGEIYGYLPEHWTFLTGELIDITALGEQFGLQFWNADGTVNHNLRTVVVDAGGLIRTNLAGNEWAVDALVHEVVRAAAAADNP
ncbi:MAG: SCO family protein [Verrucomicrobia bacterium]|nr:SCO family protein [Verrucomicrobiota bacterium]